MRLKCAGLCVSVEVAPVDGSNKLSNASVGIAALGQPLLEDHPKPAAEPRVGVADDADSPAV